MRPLDRLLWQRVPGYDSDAEEDEGEGEGEDEEGEQDDDEPGRDALAAASERRSSDPHRAPDPELLERVRANLGGRWSDAPVVDFEPLHAGRGAGVAVPPASKWTGSVSGVMPTFRIEKINAPLVRDTLLFNGLRPTGGTGFLVQWSGPRMNQALYQELHEFQRVNHFPGSTELTQKDRLWNHFHRMTRTCEGAFDFVPESFVLPVQTCEFKECYKTSRDIWIVKPHASSQGKGIYLLRDLDDLPAKDVSVVSKYVANPLLIQGLKFDLRIYVLVTSFDPLRAYIYREGLTRFASAPYSTEDEHLGDAYRHLTNYSINKKAQNFKENQKLESDNYGHKWSLSALNRHLECVGVDVNLMWTRIMDLIVKTLLSVQPVISAKVAEAKVHPQCCFELYGFDVLVDEDLKPWLLEVNLSPSMAAESPLDKQIKSSLLSDTFNLVGLRRASARTVTESRLYSQLLLMRSHRKAGRGRGTIQAEEGASEAPVDAADLPGAIDQLSEQDLKMLAFSLEEQHRCHNFIRLYPTRPAVEFYAPLSEGLSADEARRAWLLAAVLCGAERPRPEAPRPSSAAEAAPLGAEGAPDSPGTPSPRPSARSPRSGAPGDRRREAQEAADAAARGVPSFYDPAGAEAAMQVLKVLGTKMKSHLVLMEYLARVSRECDELQQADWARLAEECVVSRLRSFRQRLALFLRTDPRLSKMQAAHSLAGDGQALADVCRGAISCLASDAWAGGAPSLATGAGASPGVLLAEWLPPAFALTASGQRAIVALSGLTSADLEWILQGSQVTSEVRALLGPNADPAEESPRDGAGLSAAAVRRRLHQSRGLPYGLLSDLRDSVPQPAPRPPSDESAQRRGRAATRPPPAPSAVESLPALPRLGSKVWSSSLHSRQSSGRLKRKNSLSQLQLVAALPALLSRDIEL